MGSRVAKWSSCIPESNLPVLLVFPNSSVWLRFSTRMAVALPSHAGPFPPPPPLACNSPMIFIL